MPSSCSNLAVPTIWKIDSDGWVVENDNESVLMVWVPSDLRHVLLPPPNVLQLPTNSSVGLSFADVEIGEAWAEYYRPI